MASANYWFAGRCMPIAWQGWLVLAVYVVFCAVLPQVYSPSQRPVECFGALAIAIGVLLTINRLKGQPKLGDQ
jgi:hypothetical protein